MHITPLLLLLPIALTQIINLTTTHQNNIQPCLTYQTGNCIACPYNYHITQNQCYLNITNCIAYSINNLAQQSCIQCNATLATPDGNGGCLVKQTQLSSASNIQAIAQQYGDSRFQLIPLQTAMSDPFFLLCNSYMLNGQYSYFISRTAQPVNSVSAFTLDTLKQFKILYYASGGGLMMSIITISTTTSAIQLNSFVSIATASVIDYCGLYNDALQCAACINGYHLQNSQCFADIAGCVSYSRNICLQCSGFAVLVENRCAGCEQSGDLNKVLFWGGISSWLGMGGVPVLKQGYLVGV